MHRRVYWRVYVPWPNGGCMKMASSPAAPSSITRSTNMEADLFSISLQTALWMVLHLYCTMLTYKYGHCGACSTRNGILTCLNGNTTWNLMLFLSVRMTYLHSYLRNELYTAKIERKNKLSTLQAYTFGDFDWTWSTARFESCGARHSSSTM